MPLTPSRNFKVIKFFFFIAFNCVSITTLCQRKFSVEINFNAFIPVGSNIDQDYSPANQAGTYSYSSRERFKYPYFSFTPTILYSITSRLKMGIQSGINVHYSYPFIYRTAVVQIPLYLTGYYAVWASKEKSVGINLSGGMLLFHTNWWYLKYRNGFSVNGSIFYLARKGSILKIGFEDQIDRMTVTLPSAIFSPPFFKYPVNRLAFSATYGIMIDEFSLRKKK